MVRGPRHWNHPALLDLECPVHGFNWKPGCESCDKAEWYGCVHGRLHPPALIPLTVIDRLREAWTEEGVEDEQWAQHGVAVLDSVVASAADDARRRDTPHVTFQDLQVVQEKLGNGVRPDVEEVEALVDLLLGLPAMQHQLALEDLLRNPPGPETMSKGAREEGFMEGWRAARAWMQGYIASALATNQGEVAALLEEANHG